MVFPFNEDNLPKNGELNIEEVREAIHQRPGDAILYQFLGRAYLEAGDLSQSEQAYAKSLELDDTDPWTHLYMGNLHDTAERYDAALECFRKANQLLPDHPITHVALADAYVALEDYELADKLYRSAVEIDPNDEIAKENLKRWEDIIAESGEDEEA